MLEKAPSLEIAFKYHRKSTHYQQHNYLLAMSVVSFMSECLTNHRKYPCNSNSTVSISHSQSQEPTPLIQQNVTLAERVHQLEQKVAEQDRQLAFLNPKHDRYAPKLAAAASAWHNYIEQPGRTPKQSLLKFLTKNADNFGLVDSEGTPLKDLQDLAAIANWKPNGGAPKTPSKKSLH
ncbi:hypothetical protein DBR07_09940 [Aeromonas sp. HMWF036]|uniref:hypothetical protein n=1 Tax=unclassified Aeromonas TaxID=257493 RepID=UPI000D36038C|nr:MULTISPECIES: hypothetical protein [unclassified Aeromonas]PTS77395.1 hypothetical protein DBR07_09940 [Aeromonas sp. HMWF036]PTT26718.1 hypothetical protein DBR30_12480 [Aeromonas sp. HMWF017]